MSAYSFCFFFMAKWLLLFFNYYSIEGFFSFLAQFDLLSEAVDHRLQLFLDVEVFGGEEELRCFLKALFTLLSITLTRKRTLNIT